MTEQYQIEYYLEGFMNPIKDKGPHVFYVEGRALEEATPLALCKLELLTEGWVTKGVKSARIRIVPEGEWQPLYRDWKQVKQEDIVEEEN